MRVYPQSTLPLSWLHSTSAAVSRKNSIYSAWLVKSMPLNPSWIRHTHRGNAFKQGWPINNNRKKSRVLLSKSNRSHKIYIWWSVALDALCWISDHKVTKNTKQNIWSVLEWPKGILWRQSIDFGFRDLCPEIDAIPSQIKAWENRVCEKELNFENSKLLLTRQKPDHCKDLSVRPHTLRAHTN